MKKKYVTPPKDRKDWIDFTKKMDNIHVKKEDLVEQNIEMNRIKKLDLHGFSLIEANKKVKKFIIESFDNGYKKLLIVTGKGSRSKSYDNPYVSEQLSVLKHAIPEYIKNDENLNYKISKITQADPQEGGEGVISIFLKANKKFTK